MLEGLTLGNLREFAAYHDILNDPVRLWISHDHGEIDTYVYIYEIWEDESGLCLIHDADAKEEQLYLFDFLEMVRDEGVTDDYVLCVPEAPITEIEFYDTGTDNPDYTLLLEDTWNHHD